MEIKKATKTLAQAMLDFRANVDSVTMDSDNPFFKSKYASYNNVQETINPTLDMLGMVVVQAPNILDGVDVLNTKIYMADNPSDMIESNIRLLVPKGDMQQLGGAITYARRYALVSLFGLATDDDDGNEASQHITIPTWSDADERNNYIVDVRELVDDDQMKEALTMLSKGAEHTDKSIEAKRKASLWSGLGKEYQTKVSKFSRQKQVA
jgi:hypothetical protein|tara:strand:- start:456 stop:1082 length:627 start_codon:yes stop_codon:yes gene_type:complete